MSVLKDEFCSEEVDVLVLVQAAADDPGPG